MSLQATTTADLHQLLQPGPAPVQIAQRMGRYVEAVELMLASEHAAAQERATA